MESSFIPIFAVVAGIISFMSPSVLPLIPSYLSYVSGIPIGDLSERKGRALILRSSMSFVVGFTLVFIALGASSTLFGSLLIRHLPLILRIAGVFIIVIGLAMTGIFRIPLLMGQYRIDLAKIPQGPQGAVLLGMAFAFGWTPCIGPILATILAVASTSRTVIWGAVLLGLYSLGLGIPFILLGLGLGRARRSFEWLRRNGRMIEMVGGLLLVGVGVLFVTGVWRGLFVPLQVRFARLGWPPL